MNYLIPESLRSHYQNRAIELAHELLAADVIIVAEPVGWSVAEGILRCAGRNESPLPPVLRAEIGDPLWTRFLREQNAMADKPGNPYVDVVGRLGHMPEDTSADFRAWVTQQQDTSDNRPADIPVGQMLQILTQNRCEYSGASCQIGDSCRSTIHRRGLRSLCVGGHCSRRCARSTILVAA